MHYNSFRDMPVWQKAHKLVIRIWRITEKFPKDDKYTLVKQLRSSVLSISANIAEGFGRFHSLDKVKFYLNSRGSLQETISHLCAARDLGRLNSKEYTEMSDDLSGVRMDLNKLIKRIRSRKPQPQS